MTADVVVLLDVAEDASDDPSRHVRAFLAQLRAALDQPAGRLRLGLLRLTDRIDVIFGLNNQSNADLPRDEGAGTGKTRMAAALNVMRTRMFTVERGKRPGVVSVGVVLAARASTSAAQATEDDDVTSELQLARADGILMFAIGVDVDDVSELTSIAGSDERVVRAIDFRSLPQAARSLANGICHGE